MHEQNLPQQRIARLTSMREGEGEGYQMWEEGGEGTKMRMKVTFAVEALRTTAKPVAGYRRSVQRQMQMKTIIPPT
jgi:hypothetical protein